MKYLLLLVAVLMQLSALSSAKKKKRESMFRFADCGKSRKSSIQIKYMKIKPVTVFIPGTVYLSMGGTVTKDLPRNISLDIDIKKTFFGISIEIPCYKNRIGSCNYNNVCDTLNTYPVYGCPKGTTGKHIRCRCPFLAGDFKIDNLPISLPKIGGTFGAFVNGDYYVRVRMLSDRKQQIGCLQLGFSIRQRNKGWFFKI